MSRRSANLLMLLAALIWGVTFSVQQMAMAHVGPWFFTATRFLIGAVIVLPLALREYARLTARGIRLDKLDLLACLGLGGLIFLGVILQQIGLLTTTVTNSGFLTGLYVPLVPLLVWLLFAQPLPGLVWPAVVASSSGVFLLSGGQLSAFTTGDMLTLISTVFWALHVALVGRIAARKGSPVIVACAQFFTCGVLALLGSGMLERHELAQIEAGLPAILFAGVLSVGLAYTLQVVGQRHTRPADAAILLSSEVLFAAITGALWLDERPGGAQIVGGLLIFASIVVVQLLPGKRAAG